MGKNPHIIELPKKVVIGTYIMERIPEFLNGLGSFRRAHIITGPHVERIIREKMLGHIEKAGIEYDVSIAGEPTLDEAESIKDEVDRFKPDIIIGVGGGKSIDIAKYSSTKLGVPFLSVPTAASHDGIASPFASLKGSGKVTSVKASAPLAIIADLKIISEAPPRLLKSGAGDLVGKFTAVLDWRLSHRLKGEYYGAYAASLSLLSAKHVLNSSSLIAGGSIEATRIVMEGLVSASVAMCIAGSTRPASGSEHLFSHALDVVANYPALHGEEVALGSIMMAYLHGKDWRKLRRTIKRMGLPTTGKELGVRDKDIINALTMAHKIRPERYTILGESGLTHEAAERLAKHTEVID